MQARQDTVFFGPDAEARVVAAVPADARVLLVAMARHTEGIERLAKGLGDRVVGTFVLESPQVPGEVADAAVARARSANADWVLAHGGGTPIGVAKAIALECDVAIGAIPTSYAGSERTDIWGITRDGVKTTGRSPRVRPTLVGYAPQLVTLDAGRSAQSLFNALAHSIEAIYAVQATDEAREAARDSLKPLVDAIRGLRADATDLDARAAASRGAWKASEALYGASMALHHKLAHVLGGSFGLPHGPTHAVLLPHTLQFNLTPELLALTSEAWQTDDPAGFLYDLLRSVDQPVSLGELGLREDQIDAVVEGVLAKAYANPRPITAADLHALLSDLLLGRRPSRFTERAVLQGASGPHARLPYTVLGELDTADVVALAVHGRGSNADRFLADLRARHPGGSVAWVAPQAADNTWYPHGFLAPLADNQPHLDSALSVLDALWDTLSSRVDRARILPLGFSQGACLLLTWASRTEARPTRLFAFTGAHTPAAAGSFSAVAGAAVYLGRSAEDRWVGSDAHAVTVAALRRARATLTLSEVAGASHAIHPPDHAALARALES